MEIFGVKFEYTLNIFIVSFLIPLAIKLILRAIQKKEERDKERHNEIVLGIKELSTENKYDHGRIYSKLDDHEHRISVIEGGKKGAA